MIKITIYIINPMAKICNWHKKQKPSREIVQYGKRGSKFQLIAQHPVGAIIDRPVILQTKSHRCKAIMHYFLRKSQYFDKTLGGRSIEEPLQRIEMT